MTFTESHQIKGKGETSCVFRDFLICASAGFWIQQKAKEDPAQPPKNHITPSEAFAESPSVPWSVPAALRRMFDFEELEEKEAPPSGFASVEWGLGGSL